MTEPHSPLTGSLPAQDEQHPAEAQRAVTPRPRQNVERQIARARRDNRVALGVAALAGTLTLLGGLEAQREIQEARGDLQKQLAELDATNRQARALAAQAQGASHDLETRIAAMENRVAEAQSQQTSLELLYRDLSINQEDTVLTEVEQAVAVANQELQLAGDVRLAIRAMENASRRMERIDQPALAGLRRVIDQDLRRLRALPVVDVAEMSARLDSLSLSVDAMTLQPFARPTTPAQPAGVVKTGFWNQLGRQLLDEIGDAIRIQRSEGVSQPPLAPEQAFFLRETLRLRLLTARQALLAHDENSFRGDLRHALQWTERYYDRNDRNVQRASDLLHKLVASELTINVPDVSASLTAVRDAREIRATRAPGKHR